MDFSAENISQAIFPDNDVRSQRPQDGRDNEISQALEMLKQKPIDMEAATWANAWCLKAPEIATVIPGIKSVEQLEINANAGDITL